MKLGVVSGRYEHLINNDHFEMQPILDWPVLHRFGQTRYQLILYFLFVPLIVISFFPVPDPIVVLGPICTILVIFLGLSAMDRKLIMVLIFEFDFGILMFYLMVQLITSGIAFQRTPNGESLLAFICHTITQGVGMPFLFLSDAALTLSRKLKAILIGGILTIYVVFFIEVTFILDQTATDVPVCWVIKCISPRSLQVSAQFNTIIFLSKLLYQLRKSGTLVLPQISLALSVVPPKIPSQVPLLLSPSSPSITTQELSPVQTSDPSDQSNEKEVTLQISELREGA